MTGPSSGCNGYMNLSVVLVGPHFADMFLNRNHYRRIYDVEINKF